MEASIGPYVLGPNDRPETGIYVGDARELALPLPASSVDVIFTDPPYARAYLPLYGWVASLAARVLKPGGFLCTMAGGYYLNKVFAQMAAAELEWYFKIELSFERGPATVLHQRRMITRTKPILLWTKGPGQLSKWSMSDVYQGQGPDKRYHRWGQEVGLARYCLGYILGERRDAVVLDPFCGGGATLVACKGLHQRYLGFEIDADVTETCRGRLRGTPTPVRSDQLALFPHGVHTT